MRIAGLQKTTFLDFPGKLSCVVFTLGCNFACPFCHNGDIVDVSGHGESLISEDSFFDFLRKRVGVVEGVVISGGEPTIQKDLEKFARKIKKMGYQIKLDTNGNRPDVLKKLLEKKLIKYVAMDVKNCFEKYSQTTGVTIDIGNIKESMDILKNSKIEYEFRTTLVPGLHDLKGVRIMVEEIEKFGGKNAKLYFQNFRPQGCLDKKYLEKKSFSIKEMREFLKVGREVVSDCELREV